MPFSRDDLVRCISEGWKQHLRPLAHNWLQNPFPNYSVSISAWCAVQAQPVDWGAPQGFLVQEGQREERIQLHPRIVAWQE
jgi:hypothetical protein